MNIVINANISWKELLLRISDFGIFLAFEAFGEYEKQTVQNVIFSNLKNLYSIRYGELRDQLTGIELKTDSNETIICGGQVVKNVSGYSLFRVKETFGTNTCISKIALRIFKQPITKPYKISFSKFQRDIIIQLSKLSPDYCPWYKYHKGKFIAIIRSELPKDELKKEIAKFTKDYSCVELDSSLPQVILNHNIIAKEKIIKSFELAEKLLLSGELDIYCPIIKKGICFE